MKQYIIPVVVAVLITLLLTGFGTNRYYKSAEKQLIEQYDAKLSKNADSIKQLQLQNAELNKQKASDIIYIAKLETEIAKLKVQNSNIKGELAKTKSKIKDFTAGQAIEYFETYAKIDSGKMLVDGVDTSLIVSVPNIKKVDDIFAEHYSFGLEIANLNQIILKQDGVIVIQKNTILLYKKEIENKNTELTILRDSEGINKAKWELDIEKYKVQRNRARTALYGTGAVIVGVVVVKALLK